MHISWKNKGILRMWTDFAKTPPYTEKVALTTPPRMSAGEPFGSSAEPSPKTKGLQPIGVQLNWRFWRAARLLETWSSRILHYFLEHQSLLKFLFYFNYYEQILPFGLFGWILMWQPHFQEKGWYIVLCNEHEQIFVTVPAATLSKLTGLVLNNPVKTSSKRNLVKRLMDCKTVHIFVYNFYFMQEMGVWGSYDLCVWDY